MADKIIGEKKRYKYGTTVGVTEEARGKIKSTKAENWFLKSSSDVILWLAEFRELNKKVEFIVTSENPHREVTIKFNKLPGYLTLGWKISGYKLLEPAGQQHFEEE